MTDRELEKRVQQAFDAAAPDIFSSVMADCDGSSGRVVALAKGKRKKNGWARRAIAVAAMLTLLICAAAGGAYINGKANVVCSVVTLDVNPSIELCLNSCDKIVEASALNGDGQAVLDGLRLRGEKLDEALDSVVEAMRCKGYLTEEKNSVLITVENSDTEKAEALQGRIDAEMEKIMDAADFNGAIVSQVLEKTEELTELARSLAISPGKTRFVKAISESTGYDVEELARLNISDLNLLRTLENVDVANSAVLGGASGMSEGSAAVQALKAAGISGDMLPEVEVKLDVENGELVYNVSFSVGDYDYHYELSPNSGSIKNCVRQMTEDAKQLADDMEKWGKAQGESWETWGKKTGDEWEAWGEAQGEAWESWGENYADEWEAWAKNYADEWQTWAKQHPEEWKRLIEQHPEQWEAWAKERADEWNAWLEGNADSLGELGRFLRSWTSLFNKWWS